MGLHIILTHIIFFLVPSLLPTINFHRIPRNCSTPTALVSLTNPSSTSDCALQLTSGPSFDVGHIALPVVSPSVSPIDGSIREQVTTSINGTMPFPISSSRHHKQPIASTSLASPLTILGQCSATTSSVEAAITANDLLGTCALSSAISSATSNEDAPPVWLSVRPLPEALQRTVLAPCGGHNSASNTASRRHGLANATSTSITIDSTVSSLVPMRPMSAGISEMQLLQTSVELDKSVISPSLDDLLDDNNSNLHYMDKAQTCISSEVHVTMIIAVLFFLLKSL
ncbi:unnamed protein product [Protopolystoma xenopodis]|uniref:Uncharacterized protein n=1 Tax=Protopolystoma xenopodis TaxID=117903 RepID=A0A448XN91_9PLAT|nr:unnamed protein product [Protopolystoma xenopodis]